MTKIAVLIVGEYRTFPYCHKTMTFLYQPLSTGTDVDVFFSTWSVTKTDNLLSNHVGYNATGSLKTVTEQEIEQILKRPAVIKVHDLGKPGAPFSTDESFLIMRKGWLMGFELIKQSGIDYDYVYVMRPDLFYKRSSSFFTGEDYERYETGLGVVWGGEGGKVWQDNRPTFTATDCDFFSTYDNIKKLLTPDILELGQGPLHERWYSYIISKGLHTTTLPFIYYIEPHLIGRFPMDENSTWKEVDANYWNIFTERSEQRINR
jgi:hypothetical protein